MNTGKMNSIRKEIIPKVIANENGNIIAFEIKGWSNNSSLNFVTFFSGLIFNIYINCTKLSLMSICHEIKKIIN